MLFFLTASWASDIKRAGTSLYQIFRISTHKKPEDLCDLWDTSQKGALAKMFQALIILDIKMEHQDYWIQVDRFCSHLGGEKQEIPEDFVPNIKAYFEELSHTAMAAGSVTNIFLAKRKDGKKAVIKVYVPETEKNHEFVAGFIERFISFCKNRSGLVNSKELICEINEDFYKEYDLNEEFKSAQILWEIFKKDPDIQVSKPLISDGRKWIALEYMEGKTLPQFMLTENATEKERSEIFRLIFKFFIKTIKNGYFYSDFSPGNLLIMRKKDKLALQVIDCGGLRILTKEQSKALVEFLKVETPDRWSQAWPENCAKSFANNKETIRQFFKSFGSTDEDLANEETLRYLWRLFTAFMHPISKNKVLSSSYKEDKIAFEEHIRENMPDNARGPLRSLQLLRTFEYLFSLYYRLDVKLNLYQELEKLEKNLKRNS
ncbi:MAG: hypothetical protein H6850_00780 [Alphaproteobacteria bacterium]|nr:MAG: hypothetical protein H6850_00780 [Alphaproteobacteria bacterium]